MQLTFRTEERGQWSVLHVAGELDMATVPQMRQTILTLTSKGCQYLVLDLGGVDLIDSTGLGALVGAVKRLKSNDGQLRMVNASGRVLELFAFTGLDKVFDTYSSLDEAVS